MTKKNVAVSKIQRKHGARLFPDTSLVRASARESLGQLCRWPHLRYLIAERSDHGHAAAAAASSKL